MGKKQNKVTTMANTRPGEEGLKVTVRGTGPHDFMKALRLFKRKVADSGIMEDLRDKQYYTKPSAKRREAKKAAKARWLKAQREMDIFGDLKRKR
jgi:ribosomal protein S21